ncbi:hypothetical protein QW060_16515 [Myroides ceti]|uniref:Uncharacterized protein n=1 Tax=Paenimyroides ceti TaxID=395087 RepID=A0ABT8CVZ9_9FLAO|nr:hypothetical protein [Paenimyroides ceti]MDN3708707.1 hypothetical protein [Paenimyroides ceti]
MNKIFGFAGQLLIVAAVAFGLHYMFHSVFNTIDHWSTSTYNLIQIYFFEFILSLLMVVGIVMTKTKMPHNLGYMFLAFITVKTIANYLFISPVLKSEGDQSFVKHNFLLVFVIFLVFDVYVTFKLLNEEKGQEKNNKKV